MYTSVPCDKIFTVLPETPTENFPTYYDSLDCVIKKKKIGNLTFVSKFLIIFLQKSLYFPAEIVKLFCENYQIFLQNLSKFSYANRQIFI